ncbi:MAG TPA: dicarboxylate/amino acid:cation symporter [Rhizomicrobium sp.]|nr:dicarboxylate/amino acid:cation symporter [Rhizomicrobium sp.]
MRKGLTLLVFLATLLGVLFGLACHAFIHDPARLDSLFQALGLITTIFLRAVKMLIAPLVLATLVSGVGRMGDASDIGRIALKVMSWFIAASLVSLLLGLIMVETIAPGAGLHLKTGADAAASGLTAPPTSFGTFLANLVPTSIFDAMARNEVLQIVVFSLIAGVALTRLGEKGRQLLAITEQLANLVLQMAMFVMNLAPIAVFAAVASALAQGGIEVIGKYASYVGGFYLALALLWAMLMVAGAAVLGIAQQKTLMKAIREPALIALATTSSESAYPVLLYKLEQIGVSNRIASFVLPLGYSFNLIGSMCYCTFAALFVAQAYDISLSSLQIAQLLFLVFVASKGIANVPRASLVVVVSLLPYFHLPEAGALLILGVDHFMDMGRTCTNTVATAIAAASVAKWEGDKLALALPATAS